MNFIYFQPLTVLRQLGNNQVPESSELSACVCQYEAKFNTDFSDSIHFMIYGWFYEVQLFSESNSFFSQRCWKYYFLTFFGNLEHSKTSNFLKVVKSN